MPVLGPDEGITARSALLCIQHAVYKQVNEHIIYIVIIVTLSTT